MMTFGPIRSGIPKMSSTQPAWKFALEVDDHGRVVVATPLPPRTCVEVFVVAENNDSADLMEAAGSSLDFWENPLDDEDWNNPSPG
jgi:hypothetical protein